MSMDPEMHFSILQEAILFKRVSRTVDMYFEIAEQIGSNGADDQQKAALPDGRVPYKIGHHARYRTRR